MKFQIGDKVRIKTWKSMEKEYGVDKDGWIKTTYLFSPEVEEKLNKLFPDRILTIKGIRAGKYEMEEFGGWSESTVESLYIKPVYIPIFSRFEILDL